MTARALAKLVVTKEDIEMVAKSHNIDISDLSWADFETIAQTAIDEFGEDFSTVLLTAIQLST